MHHYCLPTVVLVVALVMAATSSGCARRIDLSRRELDRVTSRDPELALLRVFPSTRVLSEYREQATTGSYEVGKRKVRERATYRPRVRLISKRTPGRVIVSTQVNGMTVLWVDFFSDCPDSDCAYGFVLTEKGTFSLMTVPDLAGFAPPSTYRRTKLRKNRVRPTKLRSVGEANDVLAAQRQGGPLTIDLVIRKDSRRPTRTDVERARGVD